MNNEFTACKLAYIIDNKLLVYLRDDFAQIPFPNMWDFPGGVREGDETAEQCVLRELEEEFGLKLDESRLSYKQIGVNFNNTGNSYFFVAEGKQEEVDAIVFSDEGWLDKEGNVWGRPTDLLTLPDGSILVSDDYANAIYRISYKK